MIDAPFTCEVCGAEVSALGYTARDHCPRCLYSLHLDDFPGDRSSGCGGRLAPVGTERGKKTAKLVYRCEKCGIIKKNKTADDDDFEKIVRLSANPLKYQKY